ncbi:MAG TPA: hypothetical protein PKW33_11880 [Anaerolineaceae bacterium]|nr:hypothetical protein [Anaerolineaceae bacterium]HPN52279.1 hypothetical protein [Anaerolineaceae bacterium]
MSVTSLSFSAGFEEPQSNYFRLPNNWLDLLHEIRIAYKNRSIAPIKVMEYILKHTWGWQRFESGIVLSLDELQNGKRWGRRRADSGTGLSINAIRKSLSTLEELGYVEKLGFNCYRPKLKPATSDYFKLPKAWTDITAQVRSSLTVLITEYFMRHAWGFQNPQGVWLDVDELQNGRRYADGRRYDAGVGADMKSIRAALEEAVAFGLVVWTDRCEYGRLYNLHLAGMQVGQGGEYLGDLPWDQADAEESTAEVIETMKGEETVPDSFWEKPLADVLETELNRSELLAGLGIFGVPRAELAARNLSAEQICAWALYVGAADNLSNPTGLLVKLLRGGEGAPSGFVDLARLPLASWLEIMVQTGPVAQNEYLPYADVRLWESVMGQGGKGRVPAFLSNFLAEKCREYFTEDCSNPARDEQLEVEVAPAVSVRDQVAVEPEAPALGVVDTWKEAVETPAEADDRVLKDTVKTLFQNTDKKQTNTPAAVVANKSGGNKIKKELILTQQRPRTWSAAFGISRQGLPSKMAKETRFDFRWWVLKSNRCCVTLVL